MGMIQYIHVDILKWFWRELDRKHDLIRNLNIFPGHIFKCKNREKTPKNVENHEKYISL